MDEIVVSLHAWEQYCIRVEDIDRTELTELLAEQIQRPHRRVRDLVHLEGVRWAFANQTFITCYGKTDFDLPKAIGWAKLHNDRIVL